MTAGHFGFAAAVKFPAPRAPLWALMFGTYLLDVVFIVLAAAGVESFQPLDPSHPMYGQVVIHAYYTHSLVGAVMIAIVAGLIARRAWGNSSGVIIGAVVFSHWILDLIVHRPDLPILPGDLGQLPLLGFGLWRWPAVSAVVELALGIGGACLYYIRVRTVTRGRPTASSRAVIAAATTGLLILLLLAADVLGFSIVVAMGLILLLIVWCGWLDARISRAMSVR